MNCGFQFLWQVLRIAPVFRISEKIHVVFSINGSHKILNHSFSGKVFTSYSHKSWFLLLYMYIIIYNLTFCLGFSCFFSYNQFFLWHETQFSSKFGARLSFPCSFRETLNTTPPLGHCRPPAFLVFLHIFCIKTWFCIKPCSMVLHVLFILQKNLILFF
jgi:hypothetical protein